MLNRCEYLEGQATGCKGRIDDSVYLRGRRLKPGLVSKTTLCFHSGFSLTGQEVEIPTKQVYELHGQKTKYCRHQHRIAPFGAFDGGAHEKADVQSDKRCDEERNNRGQLLGRGGRASPVPAEPVPPECRSDFPSHAVRWVQEPSAPQWHEAAVATGALKGLGQTEWLEAAAGAARARVILAQTNDLLVER
jgi:hypothetical protein